jgi:photosystem II stability/assembly factor-like uncharacterized protein
MFRSSPRLTICIAAAALLAAPSLPVDAISPPGSDQAGPGPVASELVGEMAWRSIGPDRGGRSLTVTGVIGRPQEGYFGAVGGGLWKTTDGGENWVPVTDGQITSSSVGAVAVAETNSDLVFIGTGESCIRGNIQPGDGVYRSTDAGRTWQHVGFREAMNISKIRIHPTNPSVVFVAAFGQYGVPNAERGVFKSTDGGNTWRKVLYRDDKTGAADLWIDRRNPNVVFAALWEAFRVEYKMSSGGPGSGLFKSTDGGETWTEITRNPGMPSGMIGRIGVSVSGADSNRVYALVENENGGLFVSDDGGATWALVNDDRRIRQRAFYYTHVTADPENRDLVYLLNVGTFRSTDGGRTMTSFAGGDSHDLWIDPNDTEHVLHASDSGGAVTFNASAQNRTWTSRDYPTAQYYHAVTTKHLPYHVCGAQQDGPTVCLPNETGGGGGRGGGRGGRGGGGPETYSPGGSEPAYIAPDPKDTDVFFSGGNNGSFLIYTNRKNGQSREVHPYPRMFSGEPSSALVERVQWTFPIHFSPVDPNVLYTATQHVWRTTNNGQTWERISGDLTRHDPDTMGHSGGPITGDMNGPEVYATVFALAPSKVDANVIWAGSDDGLIHVTRDGGQAWTNVTPPTMPEFGRVSIIDASAFDAGTAYAAVKRPLLGDYGPHLFRTHDFGRTWTEINDGLRPDDYTHTIREDHTRRGLLYTGTQHSVYYSYDDGDSWHPLGLNLPDVQISDLIVEDTDLVIATHGRSFWVLDDIEPIRQFGPEAASAAAVYLFAPSDAIRSARNATIRYWVKQPAQDLRIEVLDGTGTVVETFEPAPAGGRGAGRGGGRGGRGGFGGGASTAVGLQSVTWNLAYPAAVSFPGMILWGASTSGPTAPPGTYQVRLTANGRSQTQSFRVRRNPLYTDVTDADLQAQFDLAIRIRDKVSEANQAVIDIRRIKADVDDRLGRSSDARLETAANALTTNVGAVEEAIYQVRNQSGQDPLNFPIKINNRLASLLRAVSRGDGAPIGNAPVIFNDLVAELKAETDKLEETLVTQLAALNQELRRLGLPVVEGR